MAITHYKMSINGTPTKIVTAGNSVNGTRVYLANVSGTTDIFIGSETVSTTDGYLLVKQNGSTVAYRQEFTLYAGDSLWAVSSASAELQILVSGNVQNG